MTTSNVRGCGFGAHAKRPAKTTITYNIVIAASAVLPLFFGPLKSNSTNGSRPSSVSVSAASRKACPYRKPTL